MTHKFKSSSIGVSSSRISKMVVIGHRGAPSQAPENTIPSFLKAIDVGVDLIELDVRSSRDGFLVVIHDERVDRTTDSEGLVSRFTLEELRSMDAGSWFSPGFKGVKIPTFEEVLNLAKGRVSVAVDLKETGIEGRVLKLLRSYGLVYGSMVIAPPEVGRRVKVSEPRITIQADLNVRGGFEGSVDELVKSLVDIASIHIEELSSDVVKYCHKRGLLVNTWTVNTVEDVLRCVEAEVDFITTDTPKLVIETLRGKDL
ncbi:hypothetical protein DRO58_01705 [Candidatus Bathyarchaeota archaeon]|nr:MAG: hypothetical protein DRO58_01705 [Candidatus Bathyarchaeota archaeon]